ncbi:MAG TPA: hypothetical protein VIA06_14540 [Candidatus Dormibacteraeota bacterium]|jgi:hypothetical protein|nr:hypothetical protein [Candidatus Dormibacteraeota bacterium]
MFSRLAFFAFGFAVGTRTGRDGVRQMLAAARWVAGRDEFQSMLGLAGNAAQVALERGQEYVTKRAA